MRDRVYREEERNNEAALLVNLLHLALHGDQGFVFLTVGELCQGCLDAVLVLAWILRARLEELKVALRVNVRPIDDQGLAVFEAFRDVKVTAISYATALSFVHLDDIFPIQFSAFVLPMKEMIRGRKHWWCSRVTLFSCCLLLSILIL